MTPTAPLARSNVLIIGPLLSWTLGCVLPHPLTAQASGESGADGREITVDIRQVAGANVYLDVGRLHGLETGDTLTASVEGQDSSRLSLVVTAAADRRSVLTHAGEATALSRGERLTLHLLRQPTVRPPAEEDRTQPRSTRSAATGIAGDNPSSTSDPSRSTRDVDNARSEVEASPHGRLTLDLAAVHSTTRFGASSPSEVGRTFATPTFGVDATVPRALGGFDFATSLRLAYRYSDRQVTQPATAVRVRTASLRRAFVSIPVQLELGRFHSPVEQYSGYWDGVMVRMGGTDLGMGALVGFEPDRWNERPSTEIPKASLFVDAARRGPTWRWNGDLSVHSVRPRFEGSPDHTFLGVSQRLTTRHLLLSHDLQIDRDPTSGGWQISDLRLRGVVPLSAALDLRLGFVRRQRYLIQRVDDPFSTKSDRVTGGLGYRIGSGYVGVDASGSRSAGDSFDTWTWTVTFASPQLPGLSGVSGSGSVSRWGGPNGEVITVAPGVHYSLGRLRIRATYRFRHTALLERESTTHGLDFSTDLALGNGLRGSVRLGGQSGATLRSQTIRVTLYRTF
jgi:hypothetical protein